MFKENKVCFSKFQHCLIHYSKVLFKKYITFQENSIRNSPWQSGNAEAFVELCLWFLVSVPAKKKKCRENWILRNLKKNTFPRIKKYILYLIHYIVWKRREVFCLIKKYILFFTRFSNLISWCRSFTVFTRLNSLFILFKLDIARILTLSYSYSGKSSTKWTKTEA